MPPAPTLADLRDLARKVVGDIRLAQHAVSEGRRPATLDRAEANAGELVGALTEYAAALALAGPADPVAGETPVEMLDQWQLDECLNGRR